MAKKKKSKQSGLRTMLIVLSVVLGVILAALVAGTIYAENLLGMINYVDPNATQATLSQEEIEALYNETEAEDEDEEEFTGPVLNEEDVVLETAAPIVVESDNVVNILLIGVDRRKNEAARSDSMILCTFNKSQGTITLTSFMRDMYLKIPGYKSNRINVSYALGGMSLLNETISYNFGVESDGAVEIDFSHFEELIDLLGGIELELTSQEANYINKECGSKLTAGVQTLNGEEALWYSRCRKVGGDGDFGRTNRQRIVLTKLLNEYKSKSLTELIGMMDDILPMVTTNMTKDEILGYIKDLFPMLATAQIVTSRIPADGAYYNAKINEMSVLVPDIPKNSELLRQILEEYPQGVG